MLYLLKLSPLDFARGEAESDFLDSPLGQKIRTQQDDIRKRSRIVKWYAEDATGILRRQGSHALHTDQNDRDSTNYEKTIFKPNN